MGHGEQTLTALTTWLANGCRHRRQNSRFVCAFSFPLLFSFYPFTDISAGMTIPVHDREMNDIVGIYLYCIFILYLQCRAMSRRSCYYQYYFQGSAFVYSVLRIPFANDPLVHFQISLWIHGLCFSLVCHTRGTNHTTSYKEPHMHGTGYIAYVSSQVPSSKVPAEYFIRRTGHGHSANPEMTSM